MLFGTVKHSWPVLVSSAIVPPATGTKRFDERSHPIIIISRNIDRIFIRAVYGEMKVHSEQSFALLLGHSGLVQGVASSAPVVGSIAWSSGSLQMGHLESSSFAIFLLASP